MITQEKIARAQEAITANLRREVDEWVNARRKTILRREVDEWVNARRKTIHIVEVQGLHDKHYDVILSSLLWGENLSDLLNDIGIYCAERHTSGCFRITPEEAALAATSLRLLGYEVSHEYPLPF